MSRGGWPGGPTSPEVALVEEHGSRAPRFQKAPLLWLALSLYPTAGGRGLWAFPVGPGGLVGGGDTLGTSSPEVGGGQWGRAHSWAWQAPQRSGLGGRPRLALPATAFSPGLRFFPGVPEPLPGITARPGQLGPGGVWEGHLLAVLRGAPSGSQQGNVASHVGILSRARGPARSLVRRGTASCPMTTHPLPFLVSATCRCQGTALCPGVGWHLRRAQSTGALLGQHGPGCRWWWAGGHAEQRLPPVPGGPRRLGGPAHRNPGARSAGWPSDSFRFQMNSSILASECPTQHGDAQWHTLAPGNGVTYCPARYPAAETSWARVLQRQPGFIRHPAPARPPPASLPRELRVLCSGPMRAAQARPHRFLGLPLWSHSQGRWSRPWPPALLSCD